MGEKEMSDLKAWLWEFQFPLSPTYMQVNAAVYKYLYDARIEPRSTAQMERYIRSWSYRFEAEFFENASKALSENEKVLLDNLLCEANDKGLTLNDLKQDPRKASIKAINVEINRLRHINKTSILSCKFYRDLSPTLLRKYHNYVMTLSPCQL